MTVARIVWTLDVFEKKQQSLLGEDEK
jgi:hypothetical protein